MHPCPSTRRPCSRTVDGTESSCRRILAQPSVSHAPQWHVQPLSKSRGWVAGLGWVLSRVGIVSPGACVLTRDGISIRSRQSGCDTSEEIHSKAMLETRRGRSDICCYAAESRSALACYMQECRHGAVIRLITLFLQCLSAGLWKWNLEAPRTFITLSKMPNWPAVRVPIMKQRAARPCVQSFT